MGRKRSGFTKGEDVRKFQLVSRPSHDAFANDPTAPSMVLEPIATRQLRKQTGLRNEELLTVPESLAAKHPEVFCDPNAALLSLEQSMVGEMLDTGDYDLEGDCYFPKDGYNYEQHLKACSGGKKGGIVGVIMEAPEPVDVKAIKKQEAESNEQADTLRALDFAEEYEEMEDGVIEELVPGGVIDKDVTLWGSTAFENRDLPDLALFGQMSGGGTSQLARLLAQMGDDLDDDEKSVATNATTKSRRDQAIDANTAKFEEFMAAEYGDDDAALSEEEIEGDLGLEDTEAAADEYIAQKRAEKDEMVSLFEPREGRVDDVPRVIGETRVLIEKYYTEDKSDTESGEEEDTDESRQWDCESVLSTLSNISNRPGTINKFKIKKAPMKTLKESDEKDEDEESSDEDVIELPEVNLDRPKGETSEERKLRKSGVRAMRKICREMKKASKDTYKAEAEKLKKTGTSDVRQGLRKLRL